MRVITDSLGGSSLTRAYLERSAPPEWYPVFLPNRTLLESVVENARGVSAEFRERNWLGSLRGAFGDGVSPAGERLKRASEGGVVITTGQQPGLFGGPLYTLSKALTALALADHVEETTGIPAAPVFWAATDDADFAESSRIVIPSSEGALELSIGKIDEVQRPLADEPLPNMDEVLGQFLRGVGSSSSSNIIDLVRDAYAGKKTIGSAYVRLLRGIFEPLGISVLDAAHPEVRAAGDSVLRAALTRSAAVSDALVARNAAIKSAGHKVQVREVKGRSLAFRYSHEGKERIQVSHAARAAAGSSGKDLSATVLLRPIMERAILPTAAYVAGPAELAYYAQVSAVADALGAQQPAVVPRWSGTVIEPRVDRILARHNLSPSDFADRHALESKHARDAIPQDARAVIQKLTDAASAAARPSGHRLVPDAVLTGLQRDISNRVERFERRVAAAVKREGTEALRDIEVARASLYPLGTPQERAVSFVALLSRYGNELPSRILTAARSHITGLQ